MLLLAAPGLAGRFALAGEGGDCLEGLVEFVNLLPSDGPFAMLASCPHDLESLANRDLTDVRTRDSDQLLHRLRCVVQGGFQLLS